MTEIRSFSRRELYNLVWKTPVEKLAGQFGLSGRGLGKLCERHAIPVPPRGYWARKNAGQRVKRTPLVEITDGTASDPEIDLRLHHPSEQTGPTAEADPYTELYERLLNEIGPVSAGKQLRNPHPLISGWLKHEESDARIARNSAYGRGFHEPRYKSSLARRRLRILDALFRELERKGCTISSTDEWKETLEVRLGQDTIEFTLSKRIRQIRRRLTDEERAERHNPDQKWTQTREPTNELTMKVSSFLPNSLSGSWQDREEEVLENQLREITAGLLAGLGYARSRREEREEQQRRQREEAEEKRRLEGEIQTELDRKTGLRQRAIARQLANELRAYVSAVLGSQVENEELKNWRKWALEHADEIDPIENGTALETSILFERPDDARHLERARFLEAPQSEPDWFWGQRWWLKS